MRQETARAMGKMTDSFSFRIFVFSQTRRRRHFFSLPFSVSLPPQNTDSRLSLPSFIAKLSLRLRSLPPPHGCDGNHTLLFPILSLPATYNFYAARLIRSESIARSSTGASDSVVGKGHPPPPMAHRPHLIVLRRPPPILLRSPPTDHRPLPTVRRPSSFARRPKSFAHPLSSIVSRPVVLRPSIILPHPPSYPVHRSSSFATSSLTHRPPPTAHRPSPSTLCPAPIALLPSSFSRHPPLIALLTPTFSQRPSPIVHHPPLIVLRPPHLAQVAQFAQLVHLAQAARLDPHAL